MGPPVWGALVVRNGLWVVAAAAGLAAIDARSDEPISHRGTEELIGGLIAMILLSCLGGVVYVRAVHTRRGSIIGGIGLVLGFSGYLMWVGAVGASGSGAGILVLGAPLASLAPVLVVVAGERRAAERVGEPCPRSRNDHG